LAWMTIEALSVVEATGQRGAVDVPVVLGVGVVAVHAGHGPVEVAVAGEVPFLVGEPTRATVGKIDRVEEGRQLEGKVLLQVSPGQVSRLKRGFHGVTLETNTQRLVFGQR